MEIAVLGTGNVGLATACFLADAGHEVRVWSAFDEERRTLQQADGIAYDGVIAGVARVFAAETVEACLTGAEAVFITAPVFAHAPLMAAAQAFIDDRQLVIVHPVAGLSSLLLSRLFADRQDKPTIVDLSTSIFPCRKTAPTAVRLLAIKDVVEVGAIPATRVGEARDLLHDLFGDRFQTVENTIAVSLGNHNPVYHVPPLLCNLSRAEKAEDWIIWDNITPGVAKFVRLVDDERMAVAERFGLPVVPVEDYFKRSYGVTGDTLDAVFAAMAKTLKGPVGPHQMDHRFILEDVPYGLVFFLALGAVGDVAMPVTESLITIASRLYERDFTAEGHTMETLGLAGMGIDGILEVAAAGF
jgi:opine dehydrogenase